MHRDFVPRGMRMQEADNTWLVHTTINRRWNHPLVAVAAEGQERREISGVRKGSSRLTMAAPPLAYVASLLIKIHIGPSPPG